ncbi:MAG: ATP-binding protein [Pseudomonadales bacterium]|nr:ATP-binding protein [Pseudomonadales bacterium]
MRPFFGRKNELEKLRLLTKKSSASLVVIRGRRRIGKSRLADEFAQSYNKLHFSGLPPSEQLSAAAQREEFAQSLSIQCNVRPPRSDDWTELFWHLAEQTKKGRYVIILDEINWMGSKDPTFLGKLKNAWDLYFSKNKKIIMILCGSMSLWIEENIVQSSGFMGRISLYLHLKELSLNDSAAFWGARRYRTSPYNIFQLLCITGGVPRYLEEIIPEQSAEENIMRLCFEPDGFLFSEFEHIFHDLFGRRRDICQRLVMALSQGPKSLNELYDDLDITKTGKIVNYLNDLEQSGFIRRDYSWNFKNGNETRVSRFRLSDNYLRFYLKYISPKKRQIEGRTISSVPNFNSILGLQFENLVLSNREIIWKAINVKKSSIINDNPYLQTATANRTGCQIDYLIQTSNSNLYLCEIKFSKNKIGKNIIREIEKKTEALKVPKATSIKPALIHVNGVTEELLESNYFDWIVDFSLAIST